MAHTKQEHVERLKLTGVVRVDTLPGTPRTGDNWVRYLDLYTAKGRYAGDAGVRCSAVAADRDRATIQCSRVLRLKKGTLTLSDMINHQGDRPVTGKTAILGGTGVYNKATGDGHITLERRRILFDLYVRG